MNVALPSIRRDLGFSAQDLQWVLSGYLVTTAGCCCSAAAPAISTPPAPKAAREQVPAPELVD
jgi:hypothetical protein